MGLRLNTAPRVEPVFMPDRQEIGLQEAIDKARAEMPYGWTIDIALESNYTRITLLSPDGTYAKLPAGLPAGEKLLQSIAIAKKLARV